MAKILHFYFFWLFPDYVCEVVSKHFILTFSFQFRSNRVKRIFFWLFLIFFLSFLFCIKKILSTRNENGDDVHTARLCGGNWLNEKQQRLIEEQIFYCLRCNCVVIDVFLFVLYKMYDCVGGNNKGKIIENFLKLRIKLF